VNRLLGPLTIAAAGTRAVRGRGPRIRVFELRLVSERIPRRRILAVTPAVVALGPTATTTTAATTATPGERRLNAPIKNHLDQALARIADHRLRERADMLQRPAGDKYADGACH
jgi:hypothetical protein